MTHTLSQEMLHNPFTTQFLARKCYKPILKFEKVSGCGYKPHAKYIRMLTKPAQAIDPNSTTKGTAITIHVVNTDYISDNTSL